MNSETEKYWLDYVDGLNLSQKKTEAIKRYIHGILKSGNVVIFSIRHLAELIGIDDEILDRMIVHPDRYYRSFSIPKRKGGTREIAIPYPALMMVQKWIYKTLLLPQTVFPECVTGFMPGCSIRDNAYPHIGSPVILKMDIKDFFPSITINRVISVFQNLGYHKKLSYALAALCCRNGSLPQGAPTSPILSNIIAKRIDKRILGFARSVGLTYTRYADDITLSGEEIQLSHIRFIERIISEEGFVINSSKTRLLGLNVKKIITGVSISSGKATIPRNLKRKIRQEIYYIKRFGAKGHIRHERIEDPVYLIRLQGRLAYWKMVEPNSEQVSSMFSIIHDALRHPRRKWWNSFIVPFTTYKKQTY